MLRTDNGTEQTTLDHLGTLILNVVKMNKPWSQEDLKQLGSYVKTSNMSPDIQKAVIYELTDAYADAMERPLQEAISKEQTEHES